MLFQDESVAPCSSPVQEVLPEQAFGLVLCFFEHLISKIGTASKEERDFKRDCMYFVKLFEGEYQSFVYNKAAAQGQQETKKIPIKDLFSYLTAFAKRILEQDLGVSSIVFLLEEMKTDPSSRSLASNLWEYVMNNSHRRVVFPYAKFSTEKEVSVEQGFHIANLFFIDLFCISRPKEEELGSDSIILEYGSSYPAEWNEAVFRVTKIPKCQQKETLISLENLFPCLMEFANIFHKRWELGASYLMNWLESMQKDPEAFPSEMQLWKNAVEGSYSVRSLRHEAMGDPYPYEEFDWESELPDNEKY